LRSDDGGQPLFLGIDSGVDRLKACVLDEELRVVWTAKVDIGSRGGGGEAERSNGVGDEPRSDGARKGTGGSDIRNAKPPSRKLLLIFSQRAFLTPTLRTDVCYTAHPDATT
jgi:hypothetical protein